MKFANAMMLCLLAAPIMAHDVMIGTTEAEWNDYLCEVVGGEREVRHYYEYGVADDTGAMPRSYITVDCETDLMVIEGGLDKRSSLDSLQQALFASTITEKAPAVVIYDTDDVIGPYEARIEAACAEADVPFLLVTNDE